MWTNGLNFSSLGFVLEEPKSWILSCQKLWTTTLKYKRSSIQHFYLFSCSYSYSSPPFRIERIKKCYMLANGRCSGHNLLSLIHVNRFANVFVFSKALVHLESSAFRPNKRDILCRIKKVHHFFYLLCWIHEIFKWCCILYSRIYLKNWLSFFVFLL